MSQRPLGINYTEYSVKCILISYDFLQFGRGERERGEK